ncbi:hypothetical protein SOV_31310 [Sporomusa ovata DSM 2662]|uniref:Uncharacterized protein n=1 Tax=Sporomusa ovata TaxID=2378 RepID=A0A0U1L410_9FIRM|nr:SiaB family protein kinase [Sporomusa ovata]EQB25085.1 hypothetical protein SOV_5c02350 [Sporomusa ovata DSM 2662]CQR73634.1 FIG062788: hypothetical protein [Sporomusa ovata]
MENNFDNLIELQKVLQNYGVLITFSGRFTQEVIEELGDAVKKYLETDATSLNVTYNVFSVFIEQTQNIKNYSMKKDSSPLGEQIANSGVVVIGKSDMGYFVSSGNLVATQDVKPLIDQLEEIKQQDKAGLRKMYKEQLKKELPEGSTTAGLGLIDMARKSSQHLTYSIVRVDEKVHFFSLQVRV